MSKNSDKIYIVRKIAVMFTCLIVCITVGLVVVAFQSKKVTVDYYGKKIQISTMSNTIEGMLMQNGIYIDEAAVVYPSQDSILVNNMEIMIYSETNTARLSIEKYIEVSSKNITEKIIKEEQDIAFEAVEKSNASKTRGIVSTVQEGVVGKKDITYTIKYLDGVEIGQNIIQQTVLQDAVNQVIEVGTAVPTVSRSSTYRVNARDLVVDGGFKAYNIKLSSDLQKYTYNMCKKYGVQYELMLSLMYCESGYNANAYSSTDDYGLCQLNGSNYTYLANKLGITNLYDPYQNIQAGTFWLARYFNSWSDEASGEELILHVLNSYNFGEGGYRNYLSYGRNAYSWHYGNKVVAAMNKLISNGGL